MTESEVGMARQTPVAQASVTSRTQKPRFGSAAVKKWAGRPLSAQRHLAAHFMAILAGDFERHGTETLATIRLENPSNYLRMAASLLPRNLDDEMLLDKVSDEELFNVIVKLRALAARSADGRGGPVQGPE
jgi:hypothetical protein